MSALREMSSSIGVEVTRIEDRVEEAKVTPRRQVDATRILYGKAASDAPRLIGSVFTLCAASQRIASEAAVAAAQSQPTPDALRWRRMLYAERIAEHLRASLLDWPGEKGDPRRLAHLPALRKALGAARAASEQNDNSLHAALKEAAWEVGAPLEAGRNPTAWFAELWRDALQYTQIAPWLSGVDFLAIDDIESVHRALCERNADFLARPHLPGRIVETGAYARHFAHLSRNIGLMAARLQARFCDIAYALDVLASREPLAGEEDLVVARSSRRGEGFAMVDSPRGFLFHRVEIDASGVVTSYDILAPTEWNFHPAGPFVQALAAAKLDVAEPRRFVATLAALFDPCASCDIRLREAQHA